MNRTEGVLSLREKQVLSLLATGLNQSQVADQMFISRHTVSFHLRNCQFKLQVGNSTAAVAKALWQRQIYYTVTT